MQTRDELLREWFTEGEAMNVAHYTASTDNDAGLTQDDFDQFVRECTEGVRCVDCGRKEIWSEDRCSDCLMAWDEAGQIEAYERRMSA